MAQGTAGHFTVWQVSWPNGQTYFGVQPAETTERFRNRLRDAERNFGEAQYINRLARACRDWGADNAVVESVSQHDQEAAAIEIANGRIASLPADKRLNGRRLIPVCKAEATCMSGDPLAVMEARILGAITTSEKRLRAALVQSTAEIERLSAMDAESRRVGRRVEGG